MLFEMRRHGIISRKATYCRDGVAVGSSQTHVTLVHGSAEAVVAGSRWWFQQQDRATWLVLDPLGGARYWASLAGWATMAFRIQSPDRVIDIWQPSWRAVHIGESERGASSVATSRLGRTLSVLLPDDLDLALAAFMLWLIAVTGDGVGVRVGITVSS